LDHKPAHDYTEQDTRIKREKELRKEWQGHSASEKRNTTTVAPVEEKSKKVTLTSDTPTSTIGIYTGARNAISYKAPATASETQNTTTQRQERITNPLNKEMQIKQKLRRKKKRTPRGVSKNNFERIIRERKEKKFLEGPNQRVRVTLSQNPRGEKSQKPPSDYDDHLSQVRGRKWRI